MKIVKIAVILLVVYAAIVAAFESMIGTIQPTPESTVVITTFDADGTPHDRVVSRLESGGQVYVAANHWPRAWYERALANPKVQVTIRTARRPTIRPCRSRAPSTSASTPTTGCRSFPRSDRLPAALFPAPRSARERNPA